MRGRLRKLLAGFLSAALAAASSRTWAAMVQADIPSSGGVPPRVVLGHVVRWMTNAISVQLAGLSPADAVITEVSQKELKAALQPGQAALHPQAVDHALIAWFLPQALREHENNPPTLGELAMPSVSVELAAARALDGQAQRMSLAVDRSPVAEGDLRPVAMSVANARRILAQGTEVLRRYRESGEAMDSETIHQAAREIWHHVVAGVSVEFSGGADSALVFSRAKPAAAEKPALPAGWEMRASGTLMGKEGDTLLRKLTGHATPKLVQPDMDISGLGALEERVLPEVLKTQLLYKRPLKAWLERQLSHPTVKNGADIESVSAAASAVNRAVQEFNRQQEQPAAALPYADALTKVYVLSDFWGEYPRKIARHLKAQGNLPNLRDVGAFYRQGLRFLTDALVRWASPRQLALILWKLQLMMAGRSPDEAQAVLERTAGQAFGEGAPSLDFPNLIQVANAPVNLRKPSARGKEPGATPGPMLDALAVESLEKETTKERNRHWYLNLTDSHGWEITVGMSRMAKEHKFEMYISWYPEDTDEDHEEGAYFVIVPDAEFSEEKDGVVAVSLFRRDLFDAVDKAVKRYFSETAPEQLDDVRRFMEVFERRLRKMEGGGNDPVPAEP